MAKISEIRKRDGSIVKFEQQKITDAIQKAFLAVQLKDGFISKKISDDIDARMLEFDLLNYEEKQKKLKEINDEVQNM